MKTLVFTSAMLLASCVVCTHAQDLITKRDGGNIQARITEVGQNEIKYKRFDNLDGPIFSIASAEVLSIKYENGEEDVFNQQNMSCGYWPVIDYGTSGKVWPGMQYKEYKRLYSLTRYVPMPDDGFSMVAAGLCSFVLPGLGQMVCGEIARGIPFMGGCVFSAFTMGYGIGMLNSNMAEGSTFAILGAIALVAVDICAVVDGVRVATIKNMYHQDLRRMASVVDVSLSPYFSTASLGTLRTPLAGVTLAVSF